jgi:ATP-dependent Lhr-like helicase
LPDLSRSAFTEIVRMLAEGFSTRRGPRAAYLHRDAVNGVLRARRGARLTALTSGGAIPDTADYEVVLEPQAQKIGTVHEDFAVESLAGDVFQLGNTSYRILRVERGRVRVEDAQGMPPTIPFWLGEAPGRSDELSFAVSRLREEISSRLFASPSAVLGVEPSALSWLADEVGLAESAASQLVEYLGAAKAALGLLPTQRELAMERFFDESGGTQLVIHSPFGSRLNRAWGLALRKRFCRKFNFELQAAATEDAIVLSLSTSHSFPLDEVTRYLHSNSVCDVLTQALLDAPMFGLRWRWNATTSLALPRFVGGAKVPPQLQRMKSEDLLATVFPDQVACAENPRRRAPGPGPSAGRTDAARLPARGDGHRRAGTSAEVAGTRRDTHCLPRPDRAVAARRRDPQCTPVCLPRRRPARGAPHAGRDEPPLGRHRQHRRFRPARP